MKRISCLLAAMILLVMLSGTAHAQCLWRGAKTMPKGSAIVMAEWYLMNFTKAYDWIGEEYKDFSSGREATTWGFETMFGYAITDRLEAHLHVPIVFKSSTTPPAEEVTSSGIGDMYFKARYAVMPWSKKKHGLTLTGSLRFATGDDEAPPALGDGTTDFGMGMIFSTRWKNKFRGHLKVNYWLNGENDNNINIGDELKLIVKLDRNLNPKVMPFLTYIYYSQSERENDGVTVDNSQKSRHYVCLGGVWKPKPGLFIRPKVSFPLSGEGGILFDYKPMIDIWYVFKI